MGYCRLTSQSCIKPKSAWSEDIKAMHSLDDLYLNKIPILLEHVE